MSTQKNKRNKNVVLIHDLHELGNRGGATALLNSGEVLILQKNYGIIRRTGVIQGRLETVETVEQYRKIYSEIRTIKWNGILVARRLKDSNYLEFTGRGYNRK